MSLRIVAGETPRLCRSTSALEPTGSLGGDVVLDDRAQHVELAVLEHAHLPVVRRRIRLALPTAECQCTSNRGTAGSPRVSGGRPRPAEPTGLCRGPLLRRRARRRLAAAGARRRPGWPPSADLVVEDVETGFCGAVVRTEKTTGGLTVTLEDRHGRHRVFPLGLGLPGRRRPGRAGPAGPAAGARRCPAVRRRARWPCTERRARVARGSRIYVEGKHDAELVEKVWGDDLRVEGVVVEHLGGIDDLPAVVREFAPGPGPPARRARRPPGRRAARSRGSPPQVVSPHVLVVGHPYVDVWQAVRPAALGIAALAGGARAGRRGRRASAPASAGRSTRPRPGGGSSAPSGRTPTWSRACSAGSRSSSTSSRTVTPAPNLGADRRGTHDPAPVGATGSGPSPPATRPHALPRHPGYQQPPPPPAVPAAAAARLRRAARLRPAAATGVRHGPLRPAGEVQARGRAVRHLPGRVRGAPRSTSARRRSARPRSSSRSSPAASAACGASSRGSCTSSGPPATPRTRPGAPLRD